MTTTVSHAQRRTADAASEAADPAWPGFTPIAIVEVELTEPLQPVRGADQDLSGARSARVFVRLHTKLLGAVDVALPDGELSAAAFAEAIWAELADAVNDHLRADGADEIGGLGVGGVGVGGVGVGGLPPDPQPSCSSRRRAILEDAPAVSVILCTRDRPDMVKRCLSSIEQSEYPNFELVVVDSSRDSQTADLVRERFPESKYVHVGSYNKCYALNRGIELASANLLAFTDDDARVDRHWIAELVEGFDDHRVASVTGIVLPMQLQTPAQVWYEESGGFTHGYQPRVIGLDVPTEGPNLLPFATGKIGAGANVAWRRDVLERFGGYDLSLDAVTPLWPRHSPPGTAGEDLAAFFDAVVRGYRIRFQSSAIAYHEHRRTYPELRRQIRWHAIALTAYLLRCLVRKPGQIIPFLLRLPKGLRYAFAHSSIRNESKSSNFPAELIRVETIGTLHGGFAYLRGLPLARRLAKADRAAHARSDRPA